MNSSFNIHIYLPASLLLCESNDAEVGGSLEGTFLQASQCLCEWVSGGVLSYKCHWSLANFIH